MTDPLSNSLPQKHTEAVKSGHSAQMEGIKKRGNFHYLFFLDLVGAAGFELATPCTPCKCATRLRYAP